jgi:hypothetical protein
VRSWNDLPPAQHQCIAEQFPTLCQANINYLYTALRPVAITLKQEFAINAPPLPLLCLCASGQPVHLYCPFSRVKKETVFAVYGTNQNRIMKVWQNSGLHSSISNTMLNHTFFSIDPWKKQGAFENTGFL